MAIVQNEEYLSEADLSVIRRRKKRAIWRDALRKRRVKRQGPNTPPGPFPTMIETPVVVATPTIFNSPGPNDPVDNSPVAEPVLASGLVLLLGYLLSQPPPATTTFAGPTAPAAQTTPARCLVVLYY